MLSVYRDHGVVRKESRADNFNKTADNRDIYQLVHPGWLIVNRMKAWQGSLGISPYRGIVSGHYICFRPQHSEEPRFLNYLLRSTAYTTELMRLSRGVRPSQIEIDNDLLRVLAIWLPTVPEQKAIAAFLDRETARIDAVVARRRAQGSLIVERMETHLRSRLSSRGTVQPLKRRWTVIDCKHRTPTYTSSGFPVVSPGDVTAGNLDLRRCHRFVDHDDFVDLTAAGRRPARGDVIYSRNASVGIASYVSTDEAFTMGQDVCLITSRDEDQRFLTLALNTLGRDQLEETKIGSTFSRVNVAQIGELLVPTPSPAEQRSIADELLAESAKAERLIAASERQIALLREHRQALVTAAVTGQLDVKKGAA